MLAMRLAAAERSPPPADHELAARDSARPAPPGCSALTPPDRVQRDGTSVGGAGKARSRSSARDRGGERARPAGAPPYLGAGGNAGRLLHGWRAAIASSRTVPARDRRVRRPEAVRGSCAARICARQPAQSIGPEAAAAGTRWRDDELEDAGDGHGPMVAEAAYRSVSGPLPTRVPADRQCACPRLAMAPTGSSTQSRAPRAHQTTRHGRSPVTTFVTRSDRVEEDHVDREAHEEHVDALRALDEQPEPPGSRWS